MSGLPEFEDPPVVEVALSVQFRVLAGLRGFTVASLYEKKWKERYPRVEEQPPLPSMVEGDTPGGPVFQFSLGIPSSVRHWFLTPDGTELVQLQQDRLSVNWREQAEGRYPRYQAMRQVFAERFGELRDFVAEEELGDIRVTQVELSYINAVTVGPDDVGKPGRILRAWRPVPDHHLGEPEQARLEMSYQVKGLGATVSRLWIQVGPGERGTGVPAMLLTFTIRGVPAGEGMAETLAFLDEGHQHVVRSFGELTTAEMHSIWRLRL